MSHVVKRLLIGHGVNPSVFEFEEVEEKDVVEELEIITTEKGALMVKPARVQFPAVFIGGKMYGGLDQVMATHITGLQIKKPRVQGCMTNDVIGFPCDRVYSDDIIHRKIAELVFFN
uniref:Glutaredoxin-C9-like n=1 Tax=Tanacetum cinerariifolium TaxID=118510 RepID=A0A6L2MUJ8_TANCI|nr:glutaredoxin-C9-like [Tanacetum cinerariifolium]